MIQTKLINFRTPADLQHTFDLVCHYKAQTRTQVLIDLMRGYVMDNHKPIIDQIQSLKDLNKNLSESIPNRTGWSRRQEYRQTDSNRDLWVSDDEDLHHSFSRGQF